MLYDELSPAQKAAMIRVCIKNGITNPDDIRTAYNNYVEGRNIFDGLSESYQKASAFGQFLANGGRVARKFDGYSEPTQQIANGKYYATNSRGDSYAFSPSALNSNEVNVTTPDIVLTANPDDVAVYRAKQWYKDFGDPHRNSAFHSEDVLPFINVLTGNVLGRLSPTQTGRAIYDTFDSELSTKDKLNSWFLGNNGVVDNEFAERYPLLSEGINIVADAGVLGSLYGLSKMVKPAYQATKAFVNPAIERTGENIGKFNQLMISPQTGKYVRFGNKEYRLSPNTASSTGFTLDSRPINVSSSAVEGFEGISVPEGFSPVQTINQNTRGGNRIVHIVKDNSTGKFKILEDMQFKSELDWSPKSWYEDAAGRRYKDGSPTQYTDRDIKDLESHVPEYAEIERKAKADGTWLKMPDGSTWEGDPRSWVQYKSRAFQEAAQDAKKEVFWTGVHKEIDPNYKGRLWGLPVENQSRIAPAKAATYAPNDSKVMPMFTVKYEDPEAVSVVDARGLDWHAIKHNGEYKKTDRIVDENFAKRKKKVVKINNVLDTGDYKVSPNSKYYYEGIGNDVRVPQNNIILNDGTFRKALVGGNGNFKHPTHMYRGIIPLATMGTGYSLFDLFDELNENHEL